MSAGAVQQAGRVGADPPAATTRAVHELVAHRVSVVISLAERAASLARTDPDRAEQTMRHVIETSRTTLLEVARLVATGRPDSDGEPLTGPSLEWIDDLAADARAAGLSVTLVQVGRPHALSAAVQTVVSRVVRESLTNVLLHSRHATAVAVSIEHGPEFVHFAVQDDGVAGRPPERTGCGGLAGLHDSVSALGGAVHAGPNAQGWLVHGEIPAH